MLQPPVKSKALPARFGAVVYTVARNHRLKVSMVPS
jgi:hypothetical protein